MTIRYFAILTACIGVALMLNQPLGSEGMTQTVVMQTGRDLDVAIVGHGYFWFFRQFSGQSGFYWGIAG